MLCSFLTSTAVEANPLGYERYSLTGIDSDVFHQRSTKHVYTHYANPLILTGDSPAEKDKRLIDIEAHVTQVRTNIRV
jgi:hypothetical protein